MAPQPGAAVPEDDGGWPAARAGPDNLQTHKTRAARASAAERSRQSSRFPHSVGRHLRVDRFISDEPPAKLELLFEPAGGSAGSLMRVLGILSHVVDPLRERL